MHVHMSSAVNNSFDDQSSCYCSGNNDVRVIAVEMRCHFNAIVVCVHVHVCVYMYVLVHVCVSSMDVIIKVAATVVEGQSIYLNVHPQIHHRHLRTIPKL